MKRVLIRQVPNGMGRARVYTTLTVMLDREVSIDTREPLIVLMDEFSDRDIAILAAEGIMAEEA